MENLTTEEARKLIELAKSSLINILSSPSMGDNISFDVQSNTTNDLFSINIYRGKINKHKYNYGAKIIKNGIILLELHVNAGNRHMNPDGTIILGSHWHYYTQETGMRYAFEASDINSMDFVDNTIKFLQEFNIINIPTINHQTDLF